MKSRKFVQTTLNYEDFEKLKILSMRRESSISNLIRNAIVEFLNTQSNQEVLHHGKNEQAVEEN